MQVKLLVSRAGIGFDQRPGDIIEVSDAEAIRMIEAGQAQPVRTGVAPEKATRNAKGKKA